MSRATQRKGDSASARALASFTAFGFDVSIPFTESARYDLIVDDGSVLSRVQCKYASGQDVNLRRIHSNSGGYVVKKPVVGDFDWLYVMRPDGSEYLITDCLGGRSYIRPGERHEMSIVMAALGK